MEWKPVKSSMLTAIAYDGNTLYVRYRGGKVYAHAGVPREKYETLMFSTSKGEYFNRHIRPHYPVSR
jgi:hypothetical protein